MAHFTRVFMFLLLIGAGWTLEKNDRKEKEKVPNLNNFVQDVRTVIEDMEEDLKEVSKEMEELKMEDASSDCGKCKFPFTLDGITYHHCKASTDPDSDQTWCSTKVDTDGKHISSNWRYCPNGDNCGGECGWTTGTDGEAGAEIETESYATDRDDCARMCKEMRKTNDKINGATYKTHTKGCWCEVRMTSRTKDSAYESCFLEDNRGIDYGDNGCSEGDRCGEGNGDCDTDAECEPGLICGRNNCAWGANKDGEIEADCCHKPHCDNKEKGKCCTKELPCERGGGYCDSDDQCIGPMKCINGADICGGKNYGEQGCQEGDKCAPGNGDCDYDSQCEGDGAICGFNNCAWGGSDDCCHKKRCHHKNKGTCCTEETPCDRNEGYCDVDAEIKHPTEERLIHRDCLPHLVCKDFSGIGHSMCVLKCQGTDDCCTYLAGGCAVMNGDCDKDSHCAGDLKCGNNNCRWGDSDDCCYDPSKGVSYY